MCRFESGGLIDIDCLVERNGGAKEGVDDIRVVVQLLVHHQSKDAHLSSTAVVQFDGFLGVQLLFVPAGFDGVFFASALHLGLSIVCESKIKSSNENN